MSLLVPHNPTIPITAPHKNYFKQFTLKPHLQCKFYCLSLSTQLSMMFQCLPVCQVTPNHCMLNKVRTDSSTEFGSNPILVDRIRIESAAGSKPILIVQIRTAVDRAVDFIERVTAFTTGRACAPISDIKGRIRPM